MNGIDGKFTDDRVRIFDAPGYVTTFHKDLEDECDFATSSDIALRALTAFTHGFCEPLRFEIMTSFWDRDYDSAIRNGSPEDPYWMLQRNQCPYIDDFSPTWTDPRVVQVDQMDYRTISNILMSALHPAESESIDIEFDEMLVGASMVKLPAETIHIADNRMTVFDRWGRSFKYPIEFKNEQIWACGPYGPSQHAPIELRLARHVGRISFEVSINWSIWAPGSPGYTEIERRISRLASTGWILAYQG